MKIVIATPLYPPDLAEPAPYVKELITRLRKDYEVGVVLFGRLPEKVEDVTFTSIDKSELLPIRILKYFKALWRATKNADILYIMDGSSVELTSGFLSIFRKIPIIAHYGDEDSNEWVNGKVILRRIRSFVKSRASAEIVSLPSRRPEIMPFSPVPTTELEKHEKEWEKHLSDLKFQFEKVIKSY